MKLEHLYDLIHSLTAQEKRYFSLHIKKSGQKKVAGYLKLFDIMDHMSAYDKKKVYEQYRRKTNMKYVEQAGNYLYDQLLTNLRSTESENHYSILLNAEILFARGLYKQCKEYLEKVTQKGEKEELNRWLLDSYKIQKNLLSTGLYSGSTEKVMDEIYKKEKTVLQRLINLCDYVHIEMNLNLFHEKKGSPLSFRDFQKINTLMGLPAMQIEPRDTASLSDREKVYYNACKSLYYFINGNWQQSYLYRKKSVEASARLYKPHQPEHLTNLCNLTICCINAKKFHEAESTIRILKDIKHKTNQDIHNYITYFIYVYELLIYQRSGEFIEGRAFINGNTNTFIQFENKMPAAKRFYIYFLSASICYGSGDLSGSLNWLTKILNHQEWKSAYELTGYSRLLYMIIHLEKENFDLLESLVRSSYRFFLNKELLTETARRVFNFFRSRLPKIIKGDTELNDEYKILKEKLEELQNIPREREVLLYFDFISWLESKIEKRSFAGIVKEKSLKPEV